MKYAYLLLCVALLLCLGALLAFRRDLRATALRTGSLGGLAGLVSEAFYFRDYWRPPSLVGVAKISLEDFLFGFAITGLSAIVYACVCKRRLAPGTFASRHKLFGLFFVIGLGCMVVFNVLLGINSIVVSSLAFVLAAAVICLLRPDLLRPALYSAGIITLGLIAIYFVLFVVMFPDYWATYWLLAHTSLGLTILGGIPVTELAWYFSWALLASISLPFVNGKKFVPVTSKTPARSSEHSS